MAWTHSKEGIKRIFIKTEFKNNNISMRNNFKNFDWIDFNKKTLKVIEDFWEKEKDKYTLTVLNEPYKSLLSQNNIPKIIEKFIKHINRPTLEQKLHDVIVKAYETKKDLECIIMHPNTWKKISDTFVDWVAKTKLNVSDVPNGLNIINYKGVNVYRSLDIEEGEFKVI